MWPTRPAQPGTSCPLGTWDGTVYTAPSGGGIVVQIDPTTDQGSVQEAAHDMMDVFDVALEFILENRLAWPNQSIEKTTEAIYWMQVNAARVALNATRTAANRVKFLEEAASWPAGLNGVVQQLVDYYAADDGIRPRRRIGVGWTRRRTRRRATPKSGTGRTGL